MQIDNKLKELFKITMNDHELRDFAKKNSLVTLSDELKELLISGETSLDEAIRIGLGHA